MVEMTFKPLHNGAQAPQQAETTMNTTEALSAAYTADERAQRLESRVTERKELAARFRMNQSLEAALLLRNSDPAAFVALNTGPTRFALAIYERERAAFYREGIFSPEAIAELAREAAGDDAQSTLANLN